MPSKPSSSAAASPVALSCASRGASPSSKGKVSAKGSSLELSMCKELKSRTSKSSVSSSSPFSSGSSGKSASSPSPKKEEASSSTKRSPEFSSATLFGASSRLFAPSYSCEASRGPLFTHTPKASIPAPSSLEGAERGVSIFFSSPSQVDAISRSPL